MRGEYIMNLPPQIAKNILRREGGYTNDKVDRGGETNFGITQPTYQLYCKAKNIPYDSIKLQTFAEKDAIDVYDWLYTYYGCHQIKNPELADIVFDACIQHGPEYPISWLQTIVGAKMDGDLGPVTAQLVNTADYRTMYYKFLAQRNIYYAKITVNRPANLKFLVGWMNREAEFTKYV